MGDTLKGSFYILVGRILSPRTNQILRKLCVVLTSESIDATPEYSNNTDFAITTRG